MVGIVNIAVGIVVGIADIVVVAFVFVAVAEVTNSGRFQLRPRTILLPQKRESDTAASDDFAEAFA